MNGSVVLATDINFAMAECSEDQVFTFEDWKEWASVTPNPVVSDAHSGNWVGIYVDGLAESTYRSVSSPYPECARIVKPIYEDAEGSKVRKLTIMVKMQPGYDSDNGNWWYGVFNESGTKMRRQGKLIGCISCHKQAAETDYLFSGEVMYGNKE